MVHKQFVHNELFKHVGYFISMKLKNVVHCRNYFSQCNFGIVYQYLKGFKILTLLLKVQNTVQLDFKIITQPLNFHMIDVVIKWLAISR